MNLFRDVAKLKAQRSAANSSSEGKSESAFGSAAKADEAENLVECFRCDSLRKPGKPCPGCKNWTSRGGVDSDTLEVLLERSGVSEEVHPKEYWFLREFLRLEVPPETAPRASRDQIDSACVYDISDSGDAVETHVLRKALWMCDQCYFRSLEAFSKLPREMRTSRAIRDLFNRIQDRFAGGPRSIEHSFVEMQDEANSAWVHFGNSEEVSRRTEARGRKAHESFMSDLVVRDIEELRSRLSIPPEDPEASNEPGPGLTVAGSALTIGSAILAFTVAPGIFGGLIWVGIGLLIYAGRRQSGWVGVREKRRIPGWSPTEIEELIKQEIQSERGVIPFAAKFLVEKKLFQAGESAEPTEWAEAVNFRWNPLGPLPALPEREMTPIEAEDYVKRCVLYLGDSGAQTTRYVDDGGVDVISDNYAIQVKHQMANIGPEVVRSMFGVATAMGKIAAVFVRSGFTKSAISFADENGILLFTYEPSIKAHSEKASEALEKGLQP